MSTAPALKDAYPSREFRMGSMETRETAFGSRLARISSLAEAIQTELDELHEERGRDAEAGLDFYAEVHRFEIELIKRALRKTGGNQRSAAKQLSLNATTLNAKIKRYRLAVGDPSSKDETPCPPDPSR